MATDMTRNRETCHQCGKPLADEHDNLVIPEGEGTELCWAEYDRCQTDEWEAMERWYADRASLLAAIAAHRAACETGHEADELRTRAALWKAAEEAGR